MARNYYIDIYKIFMIFGIKLQFNNKKNYHYVR